MNTNGIEKKRRCLFICDESWKAEEVELINVAIIEVKMLSKMPEILKKLSFCDSLIHLRRVRNGRVIVGPEEEFKEQIDLIIRSYNEYVEVQTIPVPKTAAITRRQYEFSQRYWGVKFTENRVLERKLNGTFFTSAQFELICQTISLARSEDGCVITNSEFKELGKASGSQMSALEPLKHPFMRALDNLVHERRKATKRSAQGEQYLATDCYAFVHNEPCAMCAMAMVHGRVRSVFFADPSTNGAFVTNCQLHLKPNLNHHYDVFHLTN
ncbi:CMP/dCMP-type deaminase domain-containing protein [Aphelenchoides besseyi]|nr:CMP/dCMP-type deaminase domain-containing protein [Aphelenchoides besseyi]KAI6209208.1 CMP/dCMP-type deaminase domain-containing protein [Aphelenchoides besseyi]